MNDANQAIYRSVLEENQRLVDEVNYLRKQREDADTRFAEYLPKLSMIQENLSTIAGTLMQMNSKSYTPFLSIDLDGIQPVLARIANALEVSLGPQPPTTGEDDE